MSLNISFIGAGNLATHLAKALYEKGFFISQVYSRSTSSAKLLANYLNASYTSKLSELVDSADIYFVALKDSVLNEVLSQINFHNQLIVHCSGSLPLSVLKNYSENTGVFYPLQTFSKQRRIEFASIPVFIEANSATNEEKLLKIAQQLSGSVTVLSSEKRKKIHISAVFASNFVNHFYTISAELLKSEGIPFEVLKPLIEETAQKIQEVRPGKAQTGPAVRFDENIISSHLAALEDKGNYKMIYKLISESIFEYHKNN